MKKLLLASLLVAGTASAQPAEQPAPPPAAGSAAMPDHGFAPPSDETPPTGPGSANAADSSHAADSGAPGNPVDSRPGVGEGHGEGHHDPTAHFNYAHDFWSYHGKDEYGGKLGDGKMVDPVTGQVILDEHGMPAEEEPMSPPFVFMLLNFFILLGILVWKGGPAASQMAAERHDQIKSALDEAEKLRKQAADKLAEYETRLKDADSEIKKMVEGMRKDAETDKARILDAAERQSQQMKKDAETRIAAEIELARAQLTRQVTAAATAATEKLLREKMQPADHEKLVGNFISSVQERA